MFSGSIPSNIGTQLTNLRELVLYGNTLFGDLPQSLNTMTLLSLCNLSPQNTSYVGFTCPFVPVNIACIFGRTDLCITLSHENQAMLDLLLSLHPSGWSESTPECSWNGVSCDPSTDHVTVIKLDNMNLTGTIPNTIGGLTFLQYFSISNNLNITGTIPQSIGNMTSLAYFSVSSNKMYGSIPNTIGNLKSLAYLALFENNFSGSLPDTMGNLTSLQILWIWSNQFSSLPSTHWINEFTSSTEGSRQCVEWINSIKHWKLQQTPIHLA